MTEWHPRRRALDRGAALVRELARAYHTRTLYPTGHPLHAEASQLLTGAVAELREACSADPVLFVLDSSFYLGSALLAQESLNHLRLASEFENAGLESVVFGPETSEAGLAHLVEILADGREPGEAVGGLAFNTVRPQRPTHALEQRLGGMRRSYAGALDLVRESGRQAVVDRPLDLEGAHLVVEQLAEGLNEQPGYGLLLSAVKSHDEYTEFHMVNVCVLSVALAQMIGLQAPQVVALGVGGLLHDVGKLGVAPETLSQPGRLSPAEWREIQRHPVVGAGLLFATGADLYHPAVSVALEHHVAFGMGGYPTLRRHRQPSIPARLVSVADCFDALTTKRAYRDAMGREEAVHILSAGAGDGFDPQVVQAFMQLVGIYPIGSLVELSSGETAIVVRQHHERPLQPTVLVVLDRSGTPAEIEERDLGTTDRQGRPAWRIVRPVSRSSVGIDLGHLVLSGQLEPEATDTHATGLLHEPSHGEIPPEGYVDTHADHPHDDEDRTHRHDPDVAPPFDW